MASQQTYERLKAVMDEQFAEAELPQNTVMYQNPDDTFDPEPLPRTAEPQTHRDAEPVEPAIDPPTDAQPSEPVEGNPEAVVETPEPEQPPEVQEGGTEQSEPPEPEQATAEQTEPPEPEESVWQDIPAESEPPEFADIPDEQTVEPKEDPEYAEMVEFEPPTFEEPETDWMGAFQDEQGWQAALVDRANG